MHRADRTALTPHWANIGRYSPCRMARTRSRNAECGLPPTVTGPAPDGDHSSSRRSKLEPLVERSLSDAYRSTDDGHCFEEGGGAAAIAAARVVDDVAPAFQAATRRANAPNRAA